MTTPVSNPRARRITLTTGALLVWCVVVLAGMKALEEYSAKPGRVGITPENWPADLLPGSGSDTLRLVMFLHPRCSCSMASLAELDRLLASAPSTTETTAFFFQPSSEPRVWGETRLRRRAESIPRVQVRDDIDGAVARRLGALTSGHLVVYRSGRLMFSGGVTPARAHEGDSSGRASVLASLRGERAPVRRAPVFGCGIHDPCDCHESATS